MLSTIVSFAARTVCEMRFETAWMCIKRRDVIACVRLADMINQVMNKVIYLC